LAAVQQEEAALTLSLIASIDRAGGHALVVGVLVMIVAVGALVYGVIQLAGRRRTARRRSAGATGAAEDPDA
jgi:hypothetical protein